MPSSSTWGTLMAAASCRARVDLPDPELPTTCTCRTSTAVCRAFSEMANRYPQAVDKSGALSTGFNWPLWPSRHVRHRESADSTPAKTAGSCRITKEDGDEPGQLHHADGLRDEGAGPERHAQQHLLPQ